MGLISIEEQENDRENKHFESHNHTLHTLEERYHLKEKIDDTRQPQSSLNHVSCRSNESRSDQRMVIPTVNDMYLSHGPHAKAYSYNHIGNVDYAIV
jgi:hypothetical protein